MVARKSQFYCCGYKGTVQFVQHRGPVEVKNCHQGPKILYGTGTKDCEKSKLKIKNKNNFLTEIVNKCCEIFVL